MTNFLRVYFSLCLGHPGMSLPGDGRVSRQNFTFLSFNGMIYAFCESLEVSSQLNCWMREGTLFAHMRQSDYIIWSSHVNSPKFYNQTPSQTFRKNRKKKLHRGPWVGQWVTRNVQKQVRPIMKFGWDNGTQQFLNPRKTWLGNNYSSTYNYK